MEPVALCKHTCPAVIPPHWSCPSAPDPQRIWDRNEVRQQPRPSRWTEARSTGGVPSHRSESSRGRPELRSLQHAAEVGQRHPVVGSPQGPGGSGSRWRPGPHPADGHRCVGSCAHLPSTRALTPSYLGEPFPACARRSGASGTTEASGSQGAEWTLRPRRPHPQRQRVGCEPPRGHRPLSAAHLAALLDALRHPLLSTTDRVLISLTRASSPGGLPLRGLCRVTLPEWSAEPREAERQCWGH